MWILLQGTRMTIRLDSLGIRGKCFNYKEFGHFAKECRKPKRVKDSTYHKQKMLLCKQAEKEEVDIRVCGSFRSFFLDVIKLLRLEYEHVAMNLTLLERGVAHRTNVSRPQPRSNQMKDKVLPNTSQVKFKKTEVEDHPRISRISNQTKSVTACNDSLNSRTSNVNVVCATCGKCVFNSNHDACVSKFLNDVNARTKKPNVVPISTRKPKSQANKSVATPHKKTVASESTTTNSKSYYRMLYKKTSKAWKWWIAQQCPSAYTWVPKTKKKWVPKVENEKCEKKV
ncbi:retrovirus-related pol polyprotein from transposon TNT 1-94 [Tanacetum coccineum]